MNRSLQIFWEMVLGLVPILFAVSVSLPSLSNADDTRKPNVVIFLTDDQGTLDVNCYGSKDLFTPTMDKLAKTGVRFSQAYAHCVCCPTRAMLMTGRYPQRSSVNSWTQGDANQPGKGRNMHREEITIAEVLKTAGYKTGMFGKWHLGAHRDHGPTEQGFDEYFGNRGGFIHNRNHYFLHGDGFHDLYEGKKEVFAPGKYFPDMVTERALQFIEKNKRVPFFLYVAFNIPHYPEQADKKFDDRYQEMEMPRQSYAKMISTTDDRMGMILDRIEENALRENTLVVFMSDNGHSTENYAIRSKHHKSGLPEGTNYGANGGGGNTGKWKGHKGQFFEGGIRVPAIVSWPGKLPMGVVRDQPITAMDWLPTIVDLCGLDLPDTTIDGKNLRPMILSESAPTPYKDMHWAWQRQWAVREGPWKLISLNKNNRVLVNLNDPQPERKNHIKERPDILKRLEALHDAWANETRP